MSQQIFARFSAFSWRAVAASSSGSTCSSRVDRLRAGTFSRLASRRLISSGGKNRTLNAPLDHLNGAKVGNLSEDRSRVYTLGTARTKAQRVVVISCIRQQRRYNSGRAAESTTIIVERENPRKGGGEGTQTDFEMAKERRYSSGDRAIGGGSSRFSNNSNLWPPAGEKLRMSNGFSEARAFHSAIGDDESDDSDEYTREKEELKSKSKSSVAVRKRRVATVEESDSDDDLSTRRIKRATVSKERTNSVGITQGFRIASSRLASMDEGNTSEDDFEYVAPARKAIRKEASRVSELDSLADSRSVVKRRTQTPLSKEDDSGPDSEPDSEGPQDGDSSPSHLTQTRFDQFKISPLSIKALHSVLKYERMTEVQEATFPVILSGQDVLAKARTGTGKTIAFLLPAIEMVLKAPRAESRNPVNVLIVCPTRELAQQASAEAKILLTYHRNLGSQVVYGGNPIRTEQLHLSRSPCQILVGTPGRLVDHIQRTPELRSQLRSVGLFVLDEADHMLDMGFRESLRKIMAALPSQRQTLLFSATIPDEVHSMAKFALKTDHKFIDTVGKNSQDTHAKVKQQCVVVPLEKQLSVLYSALKSHMEVEPDYKVLVFCTTARVTALMCQLYKDLGFNSREIHSRKDQRYRTRVSDEFRQSKGGIILFTSDVSARGVDYPNVTLVVQVGAPSELEQYIHRLGRTGRAGKKGEGLLVLAPWEGFFLERLQNLPITKLPVPKLNSKVENKVLSTVSDIDLKVRTMAYQAWIGYYKSLKGLSLEKAKLVHYANQFSFSMGFEEPPLLPRGLVAKMSLSGVPGIRITR